MGFLNSQEGSQCAGSRVGAGRAEGDQEGEEKGVAHGLCLISVDFGGWEVCMCVCVCVHACCTQ